jgi:hypothetical protein
MLSVWPIVCHQLIMTDASIPACHKDGNAPHLRGTIVTLTEPATTVLTPTSTLGAFRLDSRGKAGTQRDKSSPSLGVSGRSVDFKLRTTPGTKMRRSVNYLIYLFQLFQLRVLIISIKTIIVLTILFQSKQLFYFINNLFYFILYYYRMLSSPRLHHEASL